MIKQLQIKDLTIDHAQSIIKMNPSHILEIDKFGKITYVSMGDDLQNLNLKNKFRDLLPSNIKEIFRKLTIKKNKTIDAEIKVGKNTFTEKICMIPESEMMRIYIRDITQQKKDQQHSMDAHLEQKKHIEEQLLNSYKYLGLVNRKISLLAEMKKYSENNEDKKEVAKYVLGSALSLSRATAGLLYFVRNDETCKLMACSDLKKFFLEKIKVLSMEGKGIINEMLREKRIFRGGVINHSSIIPWELDGVEYFVMLPLLKGQNLKGFIYLGFDEIKDFSKEELEFLEVFTVHAAATFFGRGT